MERGKRTLGHRDWIALGDFASNCYNKNHTIKANACSCSKRLGLVPKKNGKAAPHVTLSLSPRPLIGRCSLLALYRVTSHSSPKRDTCTFCGWCELEPRWSVWTPIVASIPGLCFGELPFQSTHPLSLDNPQAAVEISHIQNTGHGAIGPLTHAVALRPAAARQRRQRPQVRPRGPHRRRVPQEGALHSQLCRQRHAGGCDVYSGRLQGRRHAGQYSCMYYGGGRTKDS